MVEKSNNEPAFPCETNGNPNGFQSGEMLWTYPGMTLRDWFAGQALAGVMAYSGNGYGEQSLDAATIASICGQIAEAMLAERSK